jgi:hypothetical protein
VTRMERYEDRRRRLVCVECEGVLSESDATRCERCRARHRRNDSARAARVRSADRAAYNRSMREYRANRVASLKCTDCTLAAMPGLRKCQAHRDSQRRRSLAYYHRRKARDRMPLVSMSVLDALQMQARRAQKCLTPEDEAMRRRVSVGYEQLLRDRGILVSRVNEPPPGWSIAEDIREEWFAISEVSALRRCA